MKIRILARRRNNYSNRRFSEEAQKLGHQVELVNPHDYEIVLTENAPTLFRKGQAFSAPDVMMPRLGASITNHGLAVVSQFEAMGVPVINKTHAIVRTRNKLRSLQLMSQHGVDIPRTVVIRRPSDMKASIERVGGFPVVIKLMSGTQGVGVILAENMNAFESMLDTLWSLGQDILLQECIKESMGRDVRVIVMGGRVVAAMRRQARLGEFRSNLHRGGVGSDIDLSDDFKAAAIKAVEIVGLDVAGVDLLESYEGPKVIEVNSSPGLEGIEAATGLNLAKEILSYLNQFEESPPKMGRAAHSS